MPAAALGVAPGTPQDVEHADGAAELAAEPAADQGKLLERHQPLPAPGELSRRLAERGLDLFEEVAWQRRRLAHLEAGGRPPDAAAP